MVSVPTWIFRGFSNVGNDDGWIFTALGGDDTGGIIWHPSILRTAAEHGLYLTKENLLVDTEAGAPMPPPGRADPAARRRDDRAGCVASTREAMRRRVVTHGRARLVLARAARQRAARTCAARSRR